MEDGTMWSLLLLLSRLLLVALEVVGGGNWLV